MIDFETDIFDECARDVLDEFPQAFVSSTEVAVPPQFPAVFIVESNNTTNKRSVDTSGEKHVNLVYTVNVYSNRVRGAKAEAKKIAGIIDKRMGFRNLRRTMLAPTPNADGSVCRYSATFVGQADAHGNLYRK